MNTIETIWLDITKDTTPSLHPKGYVLGGQPGAGKSALLEEIKTEMDNNVVIINGDDFRRYHPDFDLIQQQYGVDAPKHTAQFAGEMTQKVIERALSEQYNVAIEGTFRTSETPIKTLQDLKRHGYETSVYIKTTSKEVSWQSTLDRYNAMVKMGVPPRATPKEHHDLVVELLPVNADEVLKSGLADNFKVYSREELLFDKSANLDKMPSVCINQALSHQIDKDAVIQRTPKQEISAPVDGGFKIEPTKSRGFKL